MFNPSNHIKKRIIYHYMGEEQKIAILIPCTSNKRDNWKDIKDSYLFKITLPSFIEKVSNKYKYTFYIGYDKGDRIYGNEKSHKKLNKLNKAFSNINFRFIQFENIKKGHVTKMWNILFQQAYDDNCNYFYQTGDDIIFKTKDWDYDSIEILKKNNDIGMSGPLNNNPDILTQIMVSRKHMEIFGFFFPEEIMNWYCDDWYNYIYKPDHFFPLNNHYCENIGGDERYEINGDPNFKQKLRTGMISQEPLRQEIKKMAEKHKLLIKKYLINLGK